MPSITKPVPAASIATPSGTPLPGTLADPRHWGHEHAEHAAARRLRSALVAMACSSRACGCWRASTRRAATPWTPTASARARVRAWSVCSSRRGCTAAGRTWCPTRCRSSCSASSCCSRAGGAGLRATLWSYWSPVPRSGCSRRRDRSPSAPAASCSAGSSICGPRVLHRQPGQIAPGVVVFLFYGGMLWGVLPTESAVSWQAHLGGALGGLLAARSRAVARRPPPVLSTPTPRPRALVRTRGGGREGATSSPRSAVIDRELLDLRAEDQPDPTVIGTISQMKPETPGGPTPCC